MKITDEQIKAMYKTVEIEGVTYALILEYNDKDGFNFIIPINELKAYYRYKNDVNQRMSVDYLLNNVYTCYARFNAAGEYIG